MNQTQELGIQVKKSVTLQILTRLTEAGHLLLRTPSLRHIHVFCLQWVLCYYEEKQHYTKESRLKRWEETGKRTIKEPVKFPFCFIQFAFSCCHISRGVVVTQLIFSAKQGLTSGTKQVLLSLTASTPPCGPSPTTAS